MTQSTKTAAHQALDQKVKPLARAGLTQYKTALPKFQQQLRKLEKAITDQDTATVLTILQRELRAAMGPLAQAWTKLGDALTALNDATADEEALEAIGPEAEKLAKALSDAVKAVRVALRKGKEADEAADQAKADAAGSEERVRTVWRALCATVGNVRRCARDEVQAFLKIEAEARKAAAARDIAKVKALRKRAEGEQPGAMDRIYRTRFAGQIEKFHKGVTLGSVGKGLQAEIEHDSQALAKVDDELNKEAGEIGEALQRIQMDLVIPPPDARKAAAVLRLPPAAVERLARALALENDAGALSRALEEVAHDHKVKKSGREMVAALEKAKVL